MDYYVKKVSKSVAVFFLFILFLFCGNTVSHAQKVALKTNALAWLTASANLEAEFVLGHHFTFDVGLAGNPLVTNKFRTAFVHVQPEVRYWLNRPMSSHFIGVTAFLNNYDFLYNQVRRKGDAYAVGLTYGYAWALGRHWNIEANIGLGALRYRQYKYENHTERPADPNIKKTVLAPIRLGVTFAYIIR